MPKNKNFKIQAEVVRGECPTCDTITTLVGVSSARLGTAQSLRLPNC